MHALLPPSKLAFRDAGRTLAAAGSMIASPAAAAAAANVMGSEYRAARARAAAAEGLTSVCPPSSLDLTVLVSRSNTSGSTEIHSCSTSAVAARV